MTTTPAKPPPTPNPKHSFGAFLHETFRLHRHTHGGVESDELWIALANQTHTAWHAARLKQAQASPAAHRLYALYPRKVGNVAALHAIDAALERSSEEHLYARATEYARCVALWPKDDLKFVPHCSTWYNQGHYDDDPKEWDHGTAGPRPTTEQPAALPEPPDWLAWMREHCPHWTRLDEPTPPNWSALRRDEQQRILLNLAQK